jgi:hypothetical protein
VQVSGKSTRESTLTYLSDESNTSTIVASGDNENSKRRKVEFNLQKAKRTIKLPPLEGGKQHELHEHHRVKNPKRSHENTKLYPKTRKLKLKMVATYM